MSSKVTDGTQLTADLQAFVEGLAAVLQTQSHCHSLPFCFDLEIGNSIIFSF